MFKRFVIAFCVILLITILVGCGNLSTIEKNNSTPTKKETVNFDLSQYKDHGNLSCGLIWVEKTESAWNSDPEDFFAYFDANGTQKSRWFSCDEYWPEDFQNNYVVLSGKRKAFEDNWDYHKCTVYNKSFSEITTLYCRMPALSPCYISDFNTQGYSFAVAYDEGQKDDVLYWIDAQGEHIFQDSIDSEAYPSTIGIDEYSLRRFKCSNDYFVLVDGSSDPNYLYTKIAQIYDKKGRFILDIDYQMQKHTEECAITSAEVLEDNIVEFCFYGMDKNKYVCVMDFDGNIIKAPVLQSEYIRDAANLEKNNIDTISPGVLAVGTCADLEPYEFIDDSGNFAGVEIEMITAIAEELDLHIQFKNIPYSKLFDTLLNQQVDCIVGCLDNTEYRQEIALVSDVLLTIEEPDFITNSVIFIQKSNIPLHQKINYTIGKLNADGIFTAILKKYNL